MQLKLAYTQSIFRYYPVKDILELVISFGVPAKVAPTFGKSSNFVLRNSNGNVLEIIFPSAINNNVFVTYIFELKMPLGSRFSWSCK